MVTEESMKIPERTSASLDGLDELCQYVIKTLADGVPRTMVEVGGWTGAGTLVFRRYFDKVFVVDPWDAAEGEIAAEADVREAERIFDLRHEFNQRVHKVKGRSPDAALNFPNASLGMVYVDGLHAYPGVRADIEAWLPKIRPGGFLCGHDYETRFPGVIRAVDEKFKTLKRFPDTSWAVQV